MLLRTGYWKVSWLVFSHCIQWALIVIVNRQQRSWERWCGQRKRDANWRRSVSERRNVNEIRKFESKKSALPNEWIASGNHMQCYLSLVPIVITNKLRYPNYSHDTNHWKTAPIWNDEPFCFCMNANNNTYSCIRTINQTHNFLYCEFTTGLVTFYNLRVGKYFQCYHYGFPMHI